MDIGLLIFAIISGIMFLIGIIYIIIKCYYNYCCDYDNYIQNDLEERILHEAFDGLDI